MATITNTQARLIWGPQIPGHSMPKWIPGKNRLDVKYWEAAKLHSAVKRWLGLGWVTVDLDEDLADPTVSPSDAELAEFSVKELGAALKNPNVPVQWHPALEAELERRKAADVAKRLSPVTPPTTPTERKSLTGLRVEEARALIANEADVDTLETWAEADKRKSIDTAIDERLAELALDED